MGAVITKLFKWCAKCEEVYTSETCKHCEEARSAAS